ncbi:MAG TPA: ferredoxin reductase [Candidatus Saccharimonadales bacterium]|nr:ferredoxin reductase [Candidatus Saccharimonadales bacterium]
MARAALQRRLTWRLAEVTQLVAETPRVRSLLLRVPGWPGHRAGQHTDVRLTAEDGYTAERSYSIASAPDAGEQLTLTVERLDEGEVSPYLTEELRIGDQLELRGPIGGYFVWDLELGGPLMLIAGGSGICPLMAMLRRRASASSQVPTRLLYSSRTQEDIIYREELDRLGAAGSGLQVIPTLTRVQPPDWTGHSGRIDQAMLNDVAWSPSDHPLIYVCGPTALVEHVADALVSLGHDPERVKTERFGPSGG